MKVASTIFLLFLACNLHAQTTYQLSSSASGCTGGADFNAEVLETGAASAGLSVDVLNLATEDNFGFTAVNNPSTSGITGNYTVEVNVTTGNADLEISIAVARVNSGCVEQAISTFTAEQTATAGVKTFTLTSINLGTWASGDRLKVVYRFRDTSAHANEAATIGTGSTDAEVIAPWTLSPAGYPPRPMVVIQ